jgi:hypothetical protein
MYNGQRRGIISTVIENEQRTEKKSSSSKWIKDRGEEYQ